MSETFESFEEVRVGENLVPVNRANLFVVRHLGINAIYDHCYVVQPNGRRAYIWSYNPVFDRMTRLAEEHHAERHIDKTNADASDMETYFRHATEDLDVSSIDQISWDGNKHE